MGRQVSREMTGRKLADMTVSVVKLGHYGPTGFMRNDWQKIGRYGSICSRATVKLWETEVNSEEWPTGQCLW